MTPEQAVQLVMGLATLVNSLILWPLFRGIGKRVDALEKAGKE